MTCDECKYFYNGICWSDSDCIDMYTDEPCCPYHVNAISRVVSEMRVSVIMKNARKVNS